VGGGANQEPGRKHLGRVHSKAILKTWLRGTEAGAESRPASCGNVRKMLTAVRAMRRGQWAAARRQVAGPGPR
jgi:hypothetical protein